MKRKAPDAERPGPAKKQLLEPGQLQDPSPGTPSGGDEFDGSASRYDPDDASTGHSDSSATPRTPLTAISAASRKFPSDLKTIKCTHAGCGKTFNRPARLAAHLRSHTNDRPFKCPHAGCAKDFMEPKHLKQHIKGFHEHEKNYTCEVEGCGKSFLTGTRLRRHAAVHEGSDRFRCHGYDGCDATFRKHSTLARHVRTEHLGQKAYACPSGGCGAGLNTPAELKRHMAREHGELRFWCDECGTAAADGGGGGGGGDGPRGFRTQAQLEAHVRREHVSCMFCETRFTKQSDLERHVEIHHSSLTVEDRKTVPCPWPGCAKTFTRKSNMTAHYKTAHEGVRFVCGQVDLWESPGLETWNWTEEGCGAGFISKAKLEEHALFVHLGRQRPKAAPENDLPSRTAPGDLIDAVSGMAQESRRQVVCPVEGCAARFIRYHDLQAHLQAGHEGGKSANAGAEENALLALAEDACPTQPPGGGGGGGGSHDGLMGAGMAGGADLPEEQFWIGGGGGSPRGGRAGLDEDGEWAREQAEMMALIHFDDLIDPSL